MLTVLGVYQQKQMNKQTKQKTNQVKMKKVIASTWNSSLSNLLILGI